MAIIQISKLQQRSGNLVDLPQLDDAEFGWATNTGQLYIGKASPAENIEVLTSYSNISFSQITNSGGNIFVSTAQNGQVLGFDGIDWVNKGGIAGGLIDLGQVGNVKLGGGAIGYVLETDGQGTLSWTSKGTIRANILNLNNADPLVMTVANTTPYVNSMEVTISGVNGVNGVVVNGLSFFVGLSVDFPTSGNVTLYEDSLLTTAVDGTTMVYYDSGVATTSLVSGGSAAAQGFDTSIQYNQGSILQGSADLTFDYTNKILTVNGNASVGNLSSYRLFSNVATGTAPIVVTSTTLVPNLSVATAQLAGSVTTAAQPNITSTGTLTSLTALGNITGANITGTHYGAATGLTAIPGANVSGAVANATYADTAGTAGTVTTAAQPSITSTGTLSSVTVSANVTTGGIKTDNYYYANGVAISFTGSYSNTNVASFLPTFTGTVGATTLTSGANTTAGTMTGNWTLSAGSKLNATYADLAEYYTADAEYEPGTVLEFGGDKEVTLATDATNKVAGVVSTNPAYLMNSLCPGAYTAAIALQGRAPCRVRGTIHKGDMLIAGGDGFARPSASPLMGTVIGKSLEDFNGVSGIIECAVGRL